MTGVSAHVRASRAVALGLVVVTSGAVSHRLAGGALPSLYLLAAAVGLVALIAAPLLHRPASVLRVVAVAVLGQFAIHWFLMLGAPSGSMASDHSSGGHHHGAGGADWGATVGAHLEHEFGSANRPMLAAHLIAAVAVGLWLAAGERSLMRLLRVLAFRPLVLAVRRLGFALASPIPVHPGAVRVWRWTQDPVARRHEVLVLRIGARRGPPAFAA